MADSADEKVQRSFEFRFFFWKGEMVSAEPYWHEGKAYNWSAQEEHEASKIAAIAAKRINVPFLVVDMAMKDNGEWIVIECNDAQESGYAGNSPLGLWKKVIELESGR